MAITEIIAANTANKLTERISKASVSLYSD